MKNRKTLLAVSAMMAAAMWCAGSQAQSTTTESKIIPGATPEYPPAANSSGIDRGTTKMNKRATGSSTMGSSTMGATNPSATGMSSSTTTPTTTASNDTTRRTMRPKRDRN